MRKHGPSSIVSGTLSINVGPLPEEHHSTTQTFLLATLHKCVLPIQDVLKYIILSLGELDLNSSLVFIFLVYLTWTNSLSWLVLAEQPESLLLP